MEEYPFVGERFMMIIAREESVELLILKEKISRGKEALNVGKIFLI